MDVHIRLRRVMKDKGVTASDLARVIGVTPGRVGHFMAGANMNHNQVIAICKRLDLTTDYLLKGDESKNRGEAEILRIFRRLSPEAQDELVRAIKS